MIYLIGIGCGVNSLTREAEDVLCRATCLIGAERLLRMIPEECVSADVVRSAATRQEDILSAVESARRKDEDGVIGILFSGDSGFYSGTRLLLPLLEAYDVRVLPGISSLQVVAARCERPWQDWHICSAHGTDCDAVREVCKGKPVFFLTGGKLGPAQLCAQLAEAGLTDLPVVIGQNLGTEEEMFFRGTAGASAERTYAPLSVMLAEAAPRPHRRPPGFPDTMFERAERVPMTKQFVRAAILAKLAPEPEEICWDVGTGTGSVAIELALQAGAVYGVERNAVALELAEKNRRALGAWNLHLLQGDAPESLRDLPTPDVVFIGGSSGKLRGILSLICEKNARARVCISAVTVETLSTSAALFQELGYETDIVQIGVHQSRNMAGLHVMAAQNPVWLITGERV